MEEREWPWTLNYHGRLTQKRNECSKCSMTAPLPPSSLLLKWRRGWFTFRQKRCKPAWGKDWRIPSLFYRWGEKEEEGGKVQMSENVCSTVFCLCPGNAVQERPWWSKPPNRSPRIQKKVVWGLEGRGSSKWEGEYAMEIRCCESGNGY